MLRTVVALTCSDRWARSEREVDWRSALARLCSANRRALAVRHGSSGRAGQGAGVHARVVALAGTWLLHGEPRRGAASVGGNRSRAMLPSGRRVARAACHVLRVMCCMSRAACLTDVSRLHIETRRRARAAHWRVSSCPRGENPSGGRLPGSHGSNVRPCGAALQRRRSGATPRSSATMAVLVPDPFFRPRFCRLFRGRGALDKFTIDPRWPQRKNGSASQNSVNRRTTRPPTRAPQQPPAEAASHDNLPLSAEAASEALKALMRWRLKMMANRIDKSRKGLVGG